MTDANPMARDAARLETIAAELVPTDLARIQTRLGEFLDCPRELWQSIDAAMAAAAAESDDNKARHAFARTFVEGLHDRGLLIVPRARSTSSAVVGADTYALALAGKHHAERIAGAAVVLEQIAVQIRRLVDGPCGQPGMPEYLSRGLHALMGRGPLADLACLTGFLERWRQLLEILGAPDQAPGRAELAPLAELVRDQAAATDPGAGGAAR